MKSKIILFTESTLTGGYSLAVRDDWVYKIKRVDINEREKIQYEKDFGQSIITYSEFFDWWCKFNKIGKYDEGKEKKELKF